MEFGVLRAVAWVPLCLGLTPLQGAAPAIAEAKPTTEQRCRYEYNRYSECSKRERRRLNKQFDLPPIEELFRRQAKRSDVVIASVSFKLGGGLAMVFQRDRSGKPYAEIRRAPIAGMRYEPVRVALTEETWRAITAKSRIIDTNLYEDDNVCVGGSSFNLQAIDHLGTFRARLGDVCGEHPGNWFFQELAGIALSELPLCEGLEPEGYGEAWAGHKLYDCFLLSGDRSLAGAAYNFLEGANFWSTWNSDESGTRARLAERVVFRWPGMSLPDSGSELARSLNEQSFEPFELETTSYAGEANGSVVVRGRIKVRNKGEYGSEYRMFGTFRSVWIKHAEHGFSLSSFAAARS